MMWRDFAYRFFSYFLSFLYSRHLLNIKRCPPVQAPKQAVSAGNILAEFSLTDFLFKGTIRFHFKYIRRVRSFI